ncbi:alpha/beta fold hydrolase [Tindallia californiensis]|uniref:Pimeloyl-ACP methyl ester carboxylesterase n=1 Tax=Tindallia californiensis TaxID=159292 RepID=A0A1H3PT01_9FIRM|nr:alpha/beta hydrolase [Tindallia californiensis]SDZ03529.1 Pimeloyl-ACP methyl ester carboxylesterase [Tindallia californiensis]
MFTLTKEFCSSYGKIKYDVQGEGSPIILVHGTPWSSFNWRHIIPSLSQWFTVFYYDLLGYGQSEKTEGKDVSLGTQSKIFAELLNHLGLKAPIVVGHDFGGTTTLRTYLLEKRDFDKMILIDPVAMAPWGSPFFSHVKEHEKAFQGIPGYIHEAMVSAYIQGATYRSMDQETLKGTIKPWLGSTGQNAFYRQIVQASERYTNDIEPLYSTINHPVLIVWGEQDNWIPIERGHKLHNQISTSKFMSIPNAGHLVQEDAPTILLSHILKFLRDE